MSILDHSVNVDVKLMQHLQRILYRIVDKFPKDKALMKEYELFENHLEFIFEKIDDE